MKQNFNLLSTLFAIFLLSPQVFGQSQKPDLPEEHIQCVTDIYREELDQSLQKRISAMASRLKTRSNNGDLEIHFHIDTSYERRRTGGYNNNNQVISYMNNLANQVVTKFNVASPEWDVAQALTLTFFDGATPFSYGNGIVATIENYLDWLIANNFPGDDDVYVFYTGQYTNIGVTYLGTLCWPGVSLTGFVNSQTPNEALSSHEWMGHSANSIHYDNEPNIMKSTNATFPWHNNSLDEMEEYLDFATCVENKQSPLALVDIPYEVDCSDHKNLNLYFHVSEIQEGAKIKIMDSEQGKEWRVNKEVTLLPTKSNYSLNFKREDISKYIKLIHIDESGHQVQSEVSRIPDCGSVQWYVGDGVLYNPENKWITIHDVTGRILMQSREPNLVLEHFFPSGMLVLTDGVHTIRVWQH